MSRLQASLLGTTLTILGGWITVHNLRLSQLDGWIFWLPIASWLLVMALLCWWTALGSGNPAKRARITRCWRTGWIVGGLGLTLGFIGPLLVRPQANLGPLLGILMTGPAGFIVGVLAAAIVGTRTGGTSRT